MTRSASTTHAGSIEMPRHSITPKRIDRYRTEPIRSAPGLRRRARMSASADNRHRRDLDRHRKRQRVGAQRRSRVLARVTEDLDEKVRRAVHDFRLVTKAVGGVDEADELRDGV